MCVGGGDVILVEYLLPLLVGAGAGMLAAMGLGGGFVLLVYLILSGGEQLGAQGQNLIFFLPVIAVSLVFHFKNKLVDVRAALICGVAGALSAVLGVLVAVSLDAGILKKCFAVFIIVAGAKDLFSSGKKTAPQKPAR